jgi:hypothetical protein
MLLLRFYLPTYHNFFLGIFQTPSQFCDGGWKLFRVIQILHSKQFIITMKALFTIVLLACATLAQSQEVFEVIEDKPTAQNGIEYSYTIRNERTEESYSRYEVTIMAQNKSGCPLIYFKKAGDELNSIFEGDPSAIARFECMNATGKRLTSKGANVKAKAFKVPFTQNGTTTQIEGGYLLKNGSKVSTDLIVIVPKGEKPKFKVRIQNFSEMAD